MCGLAGVILGLKRRRRDELRVIGGLFTELLLLSQRRGIDAAGVAVVRQNGRYGLLKRPGPAAGLVADKLYWRALALDNKVTVILGHTRQKTVGSERNPLNNHPLRCNSVLGAHNGWLSNADQLTKTLGLPRVAQVDSEVLFRLVDRSRDDYEFRSLLAHCRGRISAAYVRLNEPAKLRLLKGDMPLHAAHVPGLRAIFFASEAWMLRSALDGQRHEMLDLAPFSLSTFETENVLDFTQREVFFLTPDAENYLTLLRTHVGRGPSMGRPATKARAPRTERRSPCPASP
ncbi:MAG TPA: glucosamine 6-phosphate synthetase [Planctomycetota bacterium]|nr:glucosamine 6-phosphate synthetase [Planctomycetota bacterium]